MDSNIDMNQLRSTFGIFRYSMILMLGCLCQSYCFFNRILCDNNKALDWNVEGWNQTSSNCAVWDWKTRKLTNINTFCVFQTIRRLLQRSNSLVFSLNLHLHVWDFRLKPRGKKWNLYLLGILGLKFDMNLF